MIDTTETATIYIPSTREHRRSTVEGPELMTKLTLLSFSGGMLLTELGHPYKPLPVHAIVTPYEDWCSFISFLLAG
ncbi:predicted protein [Sclerotinia sclerotiorum 1980 UF-70]|uniref:Uncharacterized protein n=1 Tax=Sclerotinia sclerotiorum (strain ATCC 18683 / 1980 / Ss-1) TaxID=665079 RepID=A7E8L1_SCLS1|nr:predicted protein [Sclerotinia sclerotiorum 1980 UF-70]XP_001597445.1 predicted protein [Sclerotinia sclerotiorum 1980 UF-70]EDN96713.1 predicted protein [Sclerotinia sclerotiorum 1980 UF-70]EDN99971.1 predicted protein [Sclerotinia sclerotiorum 1980 UF-70]